MPARRALRRRILEQHGLDLRQLDAIAADLHLRVDPAEILDLPVGREAAEVAGAVQPRARPARRRIGNELLGGQLRPIDVADGHARSADADLAGLARRNRPQRFVEKTDRVSRQRPADGHGLVGQQLGPGGGDGRLGRAVGVEHAPTGPAPALDEVRRARLAADHQEAQRRHVAFERGQQRRHTGEDGDFLLDQKVVEAGAEPAVVGRPRDQRRAGGEGRPDFLDGEIEGERHALVDAVGGVTP